MKKDSSDKTRITTPHVNIHYITTNNYNKICRVSANILYLGIWFFALDLQGITTKTLYYSSYMYMFRDNLNIPQDKTFKSCIFGLGKLTRNTFAMKSYT